MIGCRCKVGDGLSRAVLITRKLSGVVYLSPHAKKAVTEKPRNAGEAFLRPCTRLTVRGFSKLALKEFKPAFPEISFNLITGAAIATEVVRTLKTN